MDIAHNIENEICMDYHYYMESAGFYDMDGNLEFKLYRTNARGLV